MKNIVVCCDGTWNTPTEMDHGLPSPTNVVKLYYALTKDAQQEVYYHPGVGTGHNWWDKLAGGGTGEGLDQNIMSAYRWLGATYTPNDRIFLFGFSRGAYTVRSLGGLIGKCGLLNLSTVKDEPEKVWKQVGEVFASYRNEVEFTNPNNYAFHNVQPGHERKETTPIHFIGVWDTVGALGIPDDLALLGLIDSPTRYGFHDTALSSIVKFARHAVAIDEKRASFAPTLWSTHDPKTDFKQIWFPGVHCDVGGGYSETGLSDGALEWMMNEAKAPGCDLKFHPDISRQLKPDPLGPMHDSYSGVFKALKTKPRPAPLMETNSADIHQSTKDRYQTPTLTLGDYWPTLTLKVGESRTIDIYAVERWNCTRIYFEEGHTYDLTASGEWIDEKDRFDAAGGEPSGFRIGDLVRSAASLLGEAETVFKNVTHRDADFWWTRRYEKGPWFALIGFIASNSGATDKRLPDGETFIIGAKATVKPKSGGYLYCYANDAWQTYANNRGSVALTVTRQA
jgi:uncharacterized protein (DUF2235 family)